MYYIGVDSGGTKTAFVLSDDRGGILARHMSGSGGFVSRGPDRIAAMIREGVGALCDQAGITISDVAAAARQLASLAVGAGLEGLGKGAGPVDVFDLAARARADAELAESSRK